MTPAPILPPGFQAFGAYDLWVPLALDPVAEFRRQRMRIVWVAARLRPGVTLEEARLFLFFLFGY